MEYDEILQKMHCEGAAKCFENGLFSKIGSTVTSNGIQVNWHAICADINIGYLLYSIKRIDGGAPFEYASLMMSLRDDRNSRIGGGGGERYYFDPIENHFFFLRSFNDVSQLTPGRITIKADTISSSPLIRLLSPLSVSSQDIPFDMPFADNSPFYLTVEQAELKSDCIEYTFSRGSRQIASSCGSTAISSGIIRIPWDNQTPELYISSRDKNEDEKNEKLCTILSHEKDRNVSTYKCRFDTDTQTLQNLHSLYFVYTGTDYIQFKGDFGTTFSYEPDEESMRFYKLEIGKSFVHKGTDFFIKEVLVGNICTRIFVEGSPLTPDIDFRNLIRLKSGQKELTMLSASASNESIIIDFATEDISETLILEIGENIVPLM